MSRSGIRQASPAGRQKASLPDAAAQKMPDSRSDSLRLSHHGQAASISPQTAQLKDYAQLMANGSTDVVQKVDYPADSVGSFDRTMAKSVNRETGGSVDISGAELQRRIIQTAQKLQGADTGGFRLGTINFEPGAPLTRIDDPQPEGHGMQPLPDDFDPARLDTLIRPLVKGTLQDSGQWTYLLKNWPEISRSHQVVIDVDCQFNRAQGALGFHKDSRGSTVFFNLTFSNAAPMQGPDFYQDHYGVEDLEWNLPPEVQSDIASRREQEIEEDDTSIHSPVLPAFGRVSLSDPNLYHSTPKLGHRTRPPEHFERSELIDQLVQTYRHKGNFRNFFEGKSDEELLHYVEPYNLHNTESELLGQEAEEILRGEAELKQRRLSVDLTNDDTLQSALDEQAKLPRTFIRTWVRMVPKNIMDQMSPYGDMWGDKNNEKGHREQADLLENLFDKVVRA
ncbi:hypothetical protein GTP45_09720 [Pseudoduganella sp. FT55W]|uniref:Uncharacterized protein n=1 Tax=Duganella rivi TaxID=2666083 RepID=A0A7X4GP86_9BURK|nr:hypothetical protein [Duganella rivi]MYM67106.1 hypothetical protein [Duganella rivi]